MYRNDPQVKNNYFGRCYEIYNYELETIMTTSLTFPVYWVQAFNKEALFAGAYLINPVFLPYRLLSSMLVISIQIFKTFHYYNHFHTLLTRLRSAFFLYPEISALFPFREFKLPLFFNLSQLIQDNAIRMLDILWFFANPCRFLIFSEALL